MTIETQTNKVTMNGDGSATSFSFSPIVIYASDELEVTHVDANNVETLRTLGTGATNYSVDITTYPNTGSITYPADEVTPLPTGESLITRRVMTLEQDTDFRNMGGYDPADLEDALDKLEMQVQELDERLSRVPILPISSTNITDFETDRPAALESLRVTSAGTGLEWADISASTTTAAASDAAPAAVSLTAAAAGSGTDFSRDDHAHLLPVVTIARGGTGATTAGAALTALGGIADLVSDTTPQLGGDLDTNAQQVRLSKGADVASGAALTLGTDGNYFDITGAVAVTSIGTLAVGTVVRLHFDGALVLTHHATDLILPGAVNITTAAGDEAELVEYATGDWRLTRYLRNSTFPDWTKGADIASATALTLGTDGTYFDVTGTTAITSVSAKPTGTRIKLHFDGALTLTHHATNLVLPYGASITTAAGDEAELVSYGSGTWRCTSYVRSTGNLGTANTGVTATEVTDGYRHRTRLAVSVTNALDLGDAAALADGYLLYTFPAGNVVIHSAYMTVAVQAAGAQLPSDTPDVGLGTVIASGAVSVLSGTATFENIITGQTAADCNGTATVKAATPTAAVPFVMEAADAHTLHFNVADTWANDVGGDLTADITGTVVVDWEFLA